MFNILKKASAAASVLALSAGVASAATISFFDTDALDGLSVSQFDAALGTLTSASFTIIANGTTTTDATVFFFPGLSVQVTSGSFASATAVGTAATAGSSVSASVTETVSGVDLAQFAGAGNVVGNITTFFADLNSGSLEITYTYDAAPIPLPAGAPLLIAGLGGLALLRKKRAS